MSSVTTPQMTTAEVDATLATLRADGDAINAAMVDLEAHPGHSFLDSAQLSGDTSRQWAATKERIGQLWSDVLAYRSVLDQAQQVRDRRNRPGPAELAELTQLLRGPAIVRSSQDVPLDQRGLTGPATVVNRISLPELVDSMTAGYRVAAELVTSAQAVLSAYATPLDELAARFTETQELASSLGLPETGHPVLAALSTIDTELASLRELVFTDPLALPPNPVRITAVTAELDTARGTLDAIARFRDSVDQRLRQAAAELDRVAEAEDAARAAETLARQKLAVTTLPVVPDSGPELRDQLELVRRLREARDWPQATEAITALDTAVAAALRVAASAADTATALLDRRAELRGRLDAYRAKADRLGLAEDPDLTAGYQRARTLLWTLPCDLAASTRALAAYQRLIADKERTR